jgi:hypothetical protein
VFQLPAARPAPVAAALLEAPPEPAGQQSVGLASMAIVGVAPVNVAEFPLPQGNREARVQSGGERGGSRDGSPGVGADAPTVPGLAIRGNGTEAFGSSAPVEAVSLPKPPASPAPVPRAPLPGTPTVSAPLWPNSRRLLPVVEAQFTGRVAYVTVAPVPGGPDWTIWFAEPGAAGATRAFMRPPVLLPDRNRQAPPLGGLALDNGSVYLTGVLNKEGRLEGVKILNPAVEAAGSRFLEELRVWQFSPATKGATPITVEVVIDIPLPAPASRAGK